MSDINKAVDAYVRSKVTVEKGVTKLHLIEVLLMFAEFAPMGVKDIACDKKLKTMCRVSLVHLVNNMAQLVPPCVEAGNGSHMRRHPGALPDDA